MNKTAIWTIIVIVALVLVGIIIFSGGDKTDNIGTNPDSVDGTNLPNVEQETYNSLETSGDDFAAIDEALETLE